MENMENMSEIIDFYNTHFENDFASGEWQEFSSLIKQRTQFYREENAKMEAVFRKLKILDDMKIPDMNNSLEDLNKISSRFDVKSLTKNNVLLSEAEMQRKHTNYLSKLKICIKYYRNLNEKLTNEIKSAKWELEQSKVKVNEVVKLQPQEVQQLEEKAKKYENELLKFEKKYPWLKDPDFDLPNIAEQINILRNSREEKEKLIKELDVYQNLKPDIKEAKKQLADLKVQIKMYNVSEY